MTNLFRFILRKIFRTIFRLENLTHRDSYPRYQQRADAHFLSELNFGAMLNAKKYLPLSKSQLRQDIFVASQLQFKKKGFFIEFGATNGITLSNTYMLEKELGWTGILAEPAKCWHEALISNRNSIIDTRCVWSETGKELEFNQVAIAELSTINTFSNVDEHKKARETGTTYIVETISLLDLLDKCSAPKVIDYLSIDTEGSELDILNSFDFSKYKFNVITCEHNHTDARCKIHTLLKKNGYVRLCTSVSYFDDWYINEKI